MIPFSNWRPLLAVVALSFLFGSTAQGLYRRPDLQKVPIERLIKNLEAHLKKNPKDIKVKHNLARVYAMSFAWKTDTAQIRNGKELEGAWFGYEPSHVPFARKKGGNPKGGDPTKDHLSQALRLYSEVVKAQPDHLTAQLGHAWLLKAADKKEQAMKELRKVIEKAWAKEKDKKVAGLGWHSVTAEAANYLIPLLDKDKDSKEIAELQKRIAKMKRLPRPITPIVIPLREKLGVKDLVAPGARVKFDADGTGLRKQWTWITKDAGWLVSDPQRTGKITSALQFFGGVSFWLFWSNGYQALSALDDNGDGRLTGRELNGLAVWQDRNSNGISEPGEVKSLAELEIVELSCQHTVKKGSRNYVAHSSKGVKFANGKWRATYDVILHQK